MAKKRNNKGQILVELTEPQMQAVIDNHYLKKKYINLEFSRGSGKSFILGYFIKEAVQQMPRATGVLVGNTYMQMLSRTLPSTKEGLEMFGLFENIDYVVGKCGGKGFELPFQAPSNWRNAIHFRNGHVLLMVSLDMPDSGRGINSYYVIGDEAALLDQERLFLNVQTTNRSVKSEFKYSTLQNAEIFASSTPLTKKGRWFVEMEKEALKHPEEYSFLRANAYSNYKNLSKDWFKRMERKSPSKLHFDAEILNIRPPNVLNGFYSKLNPKIHYYGNKYDLIYLSEIGNNYTKKHYNSKQDTDVIRSVALDLNLDFGKNINSITVSQYLKSINEARFLKEFFNKNPKDMIDLLPDFVKYYKDHESDTINLYHDVSGYRKEEQAKETQIEKVEKFLRKHGWKVINRTPRSNNPSHEIKYWLINYLLSERDSRLPVIRINSDNCPNLCISLENAETEVKAANEYKKDKSSETLQSVPQEQATHLSDTFDYNLFWRFYELVKYIDRSGFTIPIGV